MMVTMFDDDDIARAARALRRQFHFSNSVNDDMSTSGQTTLTEWNAAIAEKTRKVAIELSEKAARIQFESMGAIYVPTPAKAA